MGIYKKHRTDVAEAPAVVAYPATTHLIRKYVNLSFWKRTVESGHSAKGRMHDAILRTTTLLSNQTQEMFLMKQGREVVLLSKASKFN